MGTSDYMYSGFLSGLGYAPTSCQDALLKKISEFLSGDEDIMVVNGYAGTGKTTALSAVISFLKGLDIKCVLLAPTGRAAKVFSSYAGMPAMTVHKCIYRQKTVTNDGTGEFSIAPNKEKDALFIVDEVSLIGIETQASQSTSWFGTGNLLDDLVNFVRRGRNCKLILMGDSAQLPPVGLDASPALSPDYMSVFGVRDYSELTTVVRQQKESGILHNATTVRNMISAFQNGISWEHGPLRLSDLGLDISGYDDVKRIDGSELIETLSDAYSSYGEDETIVLCRSNKRANKYNMGIRSAVQYKEERLVRDDKLMIVKNCYQFLEKVEGLDYIANGDIAKLRKISNFEERYGLHFADARLSLPDYDDQEISAKVILDTLDSESASLTYDQQNMLYAGVNEDYSHIANKRKRYEAIREDRYYNALQLKYADAITCHKSQGGQWKCVFIDNPFWKDELETDDLKWLYTAITRAVDRLYFVNFKDECFLKNIVTYV